MLCWQGMGSVGGSACSFPPHVVLSCSRHLPVTSLSAPPGYPPLPPSCSNAALLPFGSPAVTDDPDPLYACLAVNAWLLVAVSVALPLALLQLLEQRTAAGHSVGQRLPAERAAAQLNAGAAAAWPTKAYLRSSLVWCAVELGLHAWQAAAPGSLLSTAEGQSA